MTDKILSMIGLCRRAGKLDIGVRLSVDAVKLKNARLILTAADAARNADNLTFEINKNKSENQDKKIEERRLKYSKTELGKSLGCKEISAVCVKDEGFAREILKLLDAEAELGMGDA